MNKEKWNKLSMEKQLLYGLCAVAICPIIWLAILGTVMLDSYFDMKGQE